MKGSLQQKYSSQIRDEALRLGFSRCGFSRAGFLEEEAPLLERWLNNNMQGSMSYMANYFDKRLDPTKLVEGAKSVISLSLNYFPEEEIESKNGRISKYAYGEDYHHVIKGKITQLVDFIQENIGEVNGRAFVDSAPVMDKAWAKRSGLGWIGKNTNLINKQEGSFFFIAELICDLELDYDAPVTDHCGTCRRCIDACPTDAITEPYVVDGSRCISYFTIELKDQIPLEMKGKFKDWVFGCDICQDVCPWNRFSKPHTEPLFYPSEDLLKIKDTDWMEITDEAFKKVFGKSAIKRNGLKCLLRNIDFVKAKE
jgi:epoxyqueuosine reductase